MTDRHDRLLGHLVGATGWTSAADLSALLGVSTRSVRSYVTALKASAAPFEVIESSTSGYRLDLDAYAAFLASERNGASTAESPRERMYHLLRRLADAPDGIDLFDLATSTFVSDSTIESDIRRLRQELAGTELHLSRRDNLLRLDGPERELRALLGRLFRNDQAQGFLQLANVEREFASTDLRGFKTALISALGERGYFVNEYAVDNVLLHVAIAADRTAKRTPASAEPAPSAEEPIAADLARLIAAWFDVDLGPIDLAYLSSLLTTRVVTRDYTGSAAAGARDAVSHELEVVRSIVARVAEEYLVDLDDEDFMLRLSLHLSNLLARAQDRSFSRNPMTRSIKTSYPMIYELAVFVASELQRREGIAINDDEIAYIALHIGAHLEGRAGRAELIECVIVCPDYYDVQRLLRQRIEALLGDELQVVDVVTRTDVDWAGLGGDMIVTTIEPPEPSPAIVTIPPFLTETDIGRIRRAAARIRRQRRRSRLADELLVFFGDDLFLRDVRADDEEAMIRALGRRMIDAGVISEDYVDGAIERERMSSTAFTDTLAVPHAMSMTATRTAICIAVNETPMAWGGGQVNVVALIAFSASDRERFQAVFDQFVAVFADRADAQQLVRRGVDLPSFIDELVRAAER